jgi:hypothetical protein
VFDEEKECVDAESGSDKSAGDGCSSNDASRETAGEFAGFPCVLVASILGSPSPDSRLASASWSDAPASENE